jgi:diguanylate cyclase (GGDEF)-like protein
MVMDVVRRGLVFRLLVKLIRPEELFNILHEAAQMVSLQEEYHHVLRELSELSEQLEEHVHQLVDELKAANRERQQGKQTPEKVPPAAELILLTNRSALGPLEAMFMCGPVPLAVAIIELDFFQKSNPRFLHHGGEQVPGDLAKCLAALHSIDMLERWIGGQFMLIAPQVPRVRALVLVERLRALLQSQPFTYKGQRIPFTVAIGLVVVESEAVGYERIKQAAETALERAKATGRTCIETVAGPPAGGDV